MPYIVTLFNVEKAYVDTHDRDQLTDRLTSFIQERPDEDVMNRVSEANLSNNDRERLEKILMREFYYCSVVP